MASNPTVQTRARCRAVFGKQGVLRFTSHLDLARIWERLLRRAGLPVVYSQGFNPRPQIQFAAALPLGFASTCEIADVWLEGDIPEPDEMLAACRRAAPEGLIIHSLALVDLRGPALQTLTVSARYTALPGEEVDVGALSATVQALLARDEIVRDRRDKRYDLRPLILDLAVGEGIVIEMHLALSSQVGTGRPDEVLDELGLDPLAAQVTREAILLADPA